MSVPCAELVPWNHPPLVDARTGELLDVYIAAPPRQKAAQQQGGSTGGSEPASEGAAEGDQQQQQQEGGEQGPGSEGGADGDDDAGGTEGGEGGEGGQQEGGEEGEQKRTNAPDCAPVIDVSCSRDGYVLEYTCSLTAQGQIHIPLQAVSTCHQWRHEDMPQSCWPQSPACMLLMLNTT
jgi:hypothetical protein